MPSFYHVKKGDLVKRFVGGSPLMFLKVTDVNPNGDGFIHCGPWKFRMDNGAEVDEELGWGAEATGSYLSGAE